MPAIEIELTGDVTNARGVFTKGDRVTWPEEDALPLIAAGHAKRATAKKAAAKKATKKAPKKATGKAPVPSPSETKE